MPARSKFLPDDPWPDIRRHLERPNRAPAVCAIAYIGSTAPSHLPLRAGDLLVCNVSDDALRGRATELDALLRYLDLGVVVHNARRLHAKVIVMGDTAWVGSANASQNAAARLSEAALRTTDPSIVRSVRSYVIGLAASHLAVDKSWLESKRSLVPAKRASVPFPPVGPKTVGPPLAMPGLASTVHFIETQYGAPTPDEEAEEDRQRSAMMAQQHRAGIKARLVSAWWTGRRVPAGEWVCWVEGDRVHRPWMVAEYTKYGRDVWMWGYDPFNARPVVPREQLDATLTALDPAASSADRDVISGPLASALSGLFARPPRRTVKARSIEG